MYSLKHSITITPYTPFFVFCCCWGVFFEKKKKRHTEVSCWTDKTQCQPLKNVTVGNGEQHQDQLLHTTGLGWLRTDTLKLCAVTAHSAATTKLLSDIQNLTQRLAVTTLYETVTCHRKPILQQQKHFKKRKKRKKEKKKAGRNGRDLYDAYWGEGNQRERGAETRKFIRDVNKPHTNEQYQLNHSWPAIRIARTLGRET